jgi:hypothetical protein
MRRGARVGRAASAAAISRLSATAIRVVISSCNAKRSLVSPLNRSAHTCVWIATVLTAQVAAGAALGIAAQTFLVVAIIGYTMPWLGLGLLDMARDVAAFNLPARVGSSSGSACSGRAPERIGVPAARVGSVTPRRTFR